MKKVITLGLLLVGTLYVGYNLVPPRYNSSFEIKKFAQLPILYKGRLKPLDTTARNALLIIHGKQTYKNESKERISAIEWLMDVMMRSNVSDNYKVFYASHPDIIGLFNISHKRAADSNFNFSFNELLPHLEEIERQAQLVNAEAHLHTPYERSILKLRQDLVLYQQLVYSLTSPEYVSSLQEEYQIYHNLMPAGVRSFNQQQAGEEHNEEVLNHFMSFAHRYQVISERAAFRAIPPRVGSLDSTDWQTTGQSLIETIMTGKIDKVVLSYASLIDAYRSETPGDFNVALTNLQMLLNKRNSIGWNSFQFEYIFNYFSPFYLSLTIYVLVFIIVCFSWLIWPVTLGRAAYWLLILAFSVHTLGLLARILIQGRQPVTNLYSSAVFVGWGAVFFSVFLERIYRNGIGTSVAALLGFCTLIIAHHLGGSGDTLEMMQAVLDSNFWLATHVVTVTLGYSATFLAGFLSIIYICRGLLTKGFDSSTAGAIYRMVYGTICFALLFSFVGTVLGGIWADQSWGRFWGWDPKENGALLIVIWNALVIHAIWGKMVSNSGLMILAVIGNIITSWSWFGTNMLGVGLHSYGFTESTFFWLMLFWLSQFIFIAIGLLLNSCWRSR